MTMRLPTMKLLRAALQRLLPLLSLLVLSMAPLPPAFAAEPAASGCGPSPGGAPCAGAGPASQGNSSGTNQGAGNPINVINGNKYQREVDLAPLPGVLGLEIIRHYNSAYSGPRAPNGIMGRGWRLSYETELHAIGNSLQILQADGTRLMFGRNPANPSVCATNDPSQGRILIRRTRQGDEYTWHWPNGRRLNFDSNGKLVQILAPSGEFVSLQRDAQGLLVKVTDPQGRELHLNYLDRKHSQTGDRFRGVQSIDSPAGRFGYEYGSPPPTGATDNPRELLANLTKVSLPTHHDASAKADAHANRGLTSSSISRVYQYEDPRHPTLLTGITVSGIGSDGQLINQRIGSYQYDQEGRGILSAKGPPRQTGRDGKLVPGTGIDQVDLQFITPALPQGQPGKTVLTNSLGQKTTYTYALINEQTRLLKVSGAGCATCNESNVQYAYDKLGRMTEVTRLSPAGHPIQTTRTELDGQGRPIKVGTISYANGQAQPARALVRYEYAGESTQPTLISRPSAVPGKEHQARISYNSVRQPLSVTESGFSPVDDQGHAGTIPISRTTSYTYQTINGRSLLTQVDGPLKNGPSNSPADSDITRYRYDDRGSYRTEIIHPMNLAIRIAYDQAGRASKVTGADGVMTQTNYNPLGAVVATHRYPASLGLQAAKEAGLLLSTHALQDALGRITQITRADGQTLKLGYGINGQLAQLSDHLGNRVEWKDWNKGLESEGGRITTQQWFAADAPTHIARAWYFWYDSQDRLTQRLSPDGGLDQWAYPRETGADSSADQTSSGWTTHTDPLGRFTAWAQNANGTAQVRMAPDGEIEANISAARDTGKPLQTQDDFGRVVQFASPQHGTATAQYNAAGQIIRILQADGARIDYTLDAAGRPIQKTATRADTAATVRFGYTAQGLASVEGGVQTTAYAYDLLGRQTEKRIALNLQKNIQPSYTLRTRYDAHGRIKARQLADGNWLVFTQNGKTGLTETIALRHPILPALAEKLAAWFNAPDLPMILATRETVVTDIQASPLDGITHYVNGNGTATDFRFDQAGRLSGIEQGSGQGKAVGSIMQASYRYDAGRRLISETLDQSEVNYAYQGWNRLAPSAPTRTAPPPQRDAAGRTIQDGQYRYHYDAWGKLQTVTDAKADSKVIATYAHNAYGERVKASYADGSNQATRYYLYDNQKRVAELDQDGKLIQQYFYLDDKPIAVLDSSSRSTKLIALHIDRRGAPVAASNEDGKVIWRASYNAWGSAKVQAVTAFELDLRLPGQWEDRATHLHYNYQRDYNPHTGRYLTPDPLGFPDGPDATLYVGGDPLNKLDPLGLYQIDMHYYMTFFLGVTAGLEPKVARTIALAAQYIDDNPDTSPIDMKVGTDEDQVDVYKSVTTNQERLKYYHFMQDTLNVKSGVDIHTIMKGNQLYNLYSAYLNAPAGVTTDPGKPADCAKRFFFGEMLHALADTYSHAQPDDTPYKGVNLFNLGTGHGLNDSDPDYTFNHYGYSVLVNKLFPNSQPNANNGGTYWGTNADRTLLAEQAMFDQFISQSTWTLSGGVSFTDIKGTLVAFNATGESEQYDFSWDVKGNPSRNKHADVDHADVTDINFTFDKKLDILNSKLKQLGFDIDLTNPNWGYNEAKAANNRQIALGNLKCEDYPGTILPVGTCAMPKN